MKQIRFETNLKNMKTCSKCKQELPESSFTKSSKRRDGLNPYCKGCTKQYRTENRNKLLEKKKTAYYKDVVLTRERARERYANNSERYLEYQRKAYSTLEGRARKILTKTKERANKEGMEFNLEIQDIIIPETCPYLGIKLTHFLGKGQLPTNSSIDRIDSSKGYVKGNIEIISKLANSMKTNATKEQLITFSKSVLERFANETENS